MRQMFHILQSQLRSHADLVLVTVIASSGATPRGAGARMLVGHSGRIWGTIGGGAVEYRSQQIALTVLETKSSRGHDFTLNKEDVQDLGMICGGACQVFFHYIPAADPKVLKLCDLALQAFSRGEDIWLISDIARDGMLGLYAPSCGFADVEAPDFLTGKLSRHPQRYQEQGRDIFAEQISSSGRVYIFGGGHVAQELVPVLSHVGFRCVVLDDREAFTKRELFPTAEEILLVDFSKIADYCTIGKEDYVCVMTRGHACDTIIQAQVLPCRPSYCGVIGSIHKAAGVRRILKEEYGLTDDVLDLVTTPIGLNIRSETPAEIAISIAAQMILHRAERNGL